MYELPIENKHEIPFPHIGNPIHLKSIERKESSKMKIDDMLVKLQEIKENTLPHNGMYLLAVDLEEIDNLIAWLEKEANYDI